MAAAGVESGVEIGQGDWDLGYDETGGCGSRAGSRGRVLGQRADDEDREDAVV